LFSQCHPSTSGFTGTPGRDGSGQLLLSAIHFLSRNYEGLMISITTLVIAHPASKTNVLQRQRAAFRSRHKVVKCSTSDMVSVVAIHETSTDPAPSQLLTP
jgi:hypothetical protein